ncbi:PorP/SprF family type IX secretion system membrane protein [Massilibacteroides vaginae]|uniref:PorP/SprF family type IX secretion system membrane protein n=1 Tax=Massilibacteroides vaginae TaxID=1673718 RepID=UPI000A1C8A08|nr:type IX secretion system membrane protein PorP/SprF [Massilibacteroides vaginae]
MKRVIRSIILFLCITTAVQAQYDAQFSQYFMTMGYYNPAFAGTREDLNLLGIHRQQWVGIDGAPKSFFVSADMPLKLGETNHGVGMILFTESIGLFQNTHIAGQYAYKNKLFGGTLSIGLQLGIVNQSFDGSKALPSGKDVTTQVEDPAIPNALVSAVGLDVNAGIYYTRKNFYFGVGAMHVTEPEIMLQENVYTYIAGSYNLVSGYNIQLKNPLYELQPSVFLKSDTRTFQADVTGRVVYNKMFNGGLSWRINESIVFLLGASFGNIQVGYAYDFPTTPILKGSHGSHELMLTYKMKLKKTKTGKNKHKSVRIL